jgi:hypothetical protein
LWFVYLGLMVEMVSPDLDATNSLLMKRPRGWEYFLPLGAVNSTKRSDILNLLWLKPLANENGIACEAFKYGRDLEIRELESEEGAL